MQKFRIYFRGHWIDEQGVSPHADTIASIQEVQKPKAVSELRRFEGNVKFLVRYVQGPAKFTAPFMEFLR